MNMLPPDAVDVHVVGNDSLLVTFSNGERRSFDLTPLFTRKCYIQLKEPAFLAKAFVQYGCVTWPGNIDIDPEWLYNDSIPVNL